jgi:hypothetical protein
MLPEHIPENYDEFMQRMLMYSADKNIAVYIMYFFMFC